MLPLEEIAERCDRIGVELSAGQLTRLELIDRATALGLLCGSLERILERKRADPGLAPDAALRTHAHLGAVLAALRQLAREARTVPRDSLHIIVLDAQRDLDSACRLLAASFDAPNDGTAGANGRGFGS